MEEIAFFSGIFFFDEKEHYSELESFIKEQISTNGNVLIKSIECRGTGFFKVRYQRIYKGQFLLVKSQVA